MKSKFNKFLQEFEKETPELLFISLLERVYQLRNQG